MSDPCCYEAINAVASKLQMVVSVDDDGRVCIKGGVDLSNFGLFAYRLVAYINASIRYLNHELDFESVENAAKDFMWVANEISGMANSVPLRGDLRGGRGF